LKRVHPQVIRRQSLFKCSDRAAMVGFEFEPLVLAAAASFTCFSVPPALPVPLPRSPLTLLCAFGAFIPFFALIRPSLLNDPLSPGVFSAFPVNAACRGQTFLFPYPRVFSSIFLKEVPFLPPSRSAYPRGVLFSFPR